MSEQEHEQQDMPRANFPQGWQIAKDYDPNDHMMNLKGRDYLNVQNRLLWFLRDQRQFIAQGLARMPYVVRTELVEMDREAGFAHFKTYVRDVLGNESTMYGSEAAKDFGDYAEKASTKALGRALLALGYGTAFAPEMDEGDRVVDSPRERRTEQQQGQQGQRQPTPMRAQPQPQQAAAPGKVTPANVGTWNDLYAEALDIGLSNHEWTTLKHACGDDPVKVRQQLAAHRAKKQHVATG